LQQIALTQWLQQIALTLLESGEGNDWSAFGIELLHGAARLLRVAREASSRQKIVPIRHSQDLPKADDRSEIQRTFSLL
jgi:hypothetical protein